MRGTLAVTGDPDADALLNTDSLALVVGMLLDQQVPMEWAFRAPTVLKERLGERFAPPAIAAMDAEDLVAVFCAKPALHRYPAVMARRLHALCVHLVEHHEGVASNVWEGVASGDELYERIRALPGFGDEKARIFLALLAKRLDLRPVGWEERAGPFADDKPRSVADISSRAAFAQVREWKKAQRAMGKGKAD